MGGKNVKNTMIERVLQIVAPHPCSGCGKNGTILCNDCKNDIKHEPFYGCILCGVPQVYGICEYHQVPIARAFTVSTRQDTLETLINRLKFEHTKAASLPLGELLHESLPSLPQGTVVVPIPTVRSHIRERGYDQVELLARQFLAQRKDEPLLYRRLLRRVNTATQHKLARKDRIKQAGAAFALTSSYQLNGMRVLLIDDIVTTGSTVCAAARLLKDAGATVWVASLAYQPLD